MISAFAHFAEALCFFRPAPEHLLWGWGEGAVFTVVPLFLLVSLASLCQQTNLARAPLSVGAAPDQGSGSEPAATVPSTRNAKEYRYSVLQTRCARMEQDLRATQGVLAIVRSKQPRPAEREAFLLEELDRMSSDLLCKLSGSPRAMELLIS